MDKAVSNVISSLTYGRRFEYDDPRLVKLLDRLRAGVEEDQGVLREVRGGRRGGGLALNPASGRRARGGAAGEKPFQGPRPGDGGAARRLRNPSSSVTGSH